MKLKLNCLCCGEQNEHDLYGGLDVTPLSPMMREIIMILVSEPGKAFRARDLVAIIYATKEDFGDGEHVVRNQVRLIRMALGNDTIKTTPDGYRLG